MYCDVFSMKDHVLISYPISYLLEILLCVYPPFSLGLFVFRSRFALCGGALVGASSTPLS
jgi:hypothetical protein